MKISSAMTRRLFWSVAIVLGFLQAWASRMDLVNDTVSYLDMGDYIFAGHWSMAVNGVWSPLYAVLLGLTLHTLRPSPYWQYPAVHLLLFFIFLFAAACFDFFLRQLIFFKQEEDENASAVPAWVYPTIGYLLFLWSSLGLIRVSETNPDMLVAAFFYLACGFLLRIRRSQARMWTYAGLGLSLGLGYLTKSAMFPISLICLGVVCLVEVKLQKRIYGVTIALILFLAISAPLIAGLSISRGKFTFSESGTYNYLVHINHIPSSHWQGAPEKGQRLLHPTVKIFDRPEAFLFESSPGGSYPVWFDPSYWYFGAKPRFALREMVQTAYTNLKHLTLLVLVALNGSAAISLFLLFLVSDSVRLALWNAARYWFLLVPSIAALGMYVIVHLEARYIAAFLVVAILCLFMSVPGTAKPEQHRLLSGMAILMTLMFLSPIGPDTIPKNSPALLEFLKPLDAEPNPSEQVARGLEAMGLRTGDRIASLEYGLCAIRVIMCEGASTWARLGGFRIVAEVFYWPEEPATRGNNFWDADEATQERLLRALGQSGARLVVSRQTPSGSDANSWKQIGHTPYYARWLVAPPNLGLTPLHGPLAVCGFNPRYFCDADNKVVFLAGDHTWGDFQDLGNKQAPNTGAFDFEGYMKFQKSYGYTWLRLWSFMFSREAPGCAKCNATQVGPVWPWVRSGPGTANDGLLKTDLTQLDSKYFSRLRNRIFTASQNGLYVSLMLFSDVSGADNAMDGDPFLSGNNVNGVNCSVPCPVTLPLNSTVWKYEQAYIHKVVDTVHDLPNVLYEVDNEPPLASASWATQVMNEIRNYEFSTYGSKHPVGINYGNHVPDSNVYNTNADWVSVSKALPPAATGQCPVVTGNGGSANPFSGRCKAVVNDTDHSAYYLELQSTGADGQIAIMWENFTLGNGVAFMDPYTFPWPGRNTCKGAMKDGDSGLCAVDGLDPHWNPIRQAIGDIARYAEKVDLKDMIPEQALFSSGYGLASTVAPVSYLMFNPNGSKAEKITTVAGTYTVEVFDTNTHGIVSIASNVSVGPSYIFNPPGSDNYAVWIH